MKKRIFSCLLAVMILFSLVPPEAVQVWAVSEFHASNDCITILKKEEGFSEKPYWDYSQYTVGYGTKCPDDKLEYYREHGITEEEAEALLRDHLAEIEADLNKFINKKGLSLPQYKFDALLLFSYNCGTGWTYETTGKFYNAVVKGATGNEFLQAIALWCSAGGQIKTFLIRRRLSEANMYLNGIYDQNPPENYCYVLYDAQGGSANPRIQAYNSRLTAAVQSTATYEGHIFKGWYTEKTGGIQVNVLDADVKGARLYAHWEEDPNAGKEEPMKPLEITVTGTEVNLRQGPGTNYTIVGQAKQGDKLTITEVATGSGYTWGKFDGGWICLDYTNYAELTAPEPTEPEPTEPEPTEPEPTDPDPTQPEISDPEPTEPEATEPETKPEPPKQQTGTVKVSDCLRVRSGAGTGYAVVGYLFNGDRVEISERKTVGATVWGNIKTGWISLDYVRLDSLPEQTPEEKPEDKPEQKPEETVKWTGTVINTDVLRIRKGPGTEHPIAGYLSGGDRVEITEKKTNGSMIWGKISGGWISLDYVRLDATGEEPDPTQTGKVRVEDVLRIRKGPGTSYAVVGYLQNGDAVQILERRSVGSSEWGRIEAGWISLSYVEFEKTEGDTTPDEPKPQKRTVNTDCLRIRSKPGTENAVVGYLYRGDKVTILETKTHGSMQWGRIKTGWISLDYVK